ncbi:MAG: hypothetical protein ACR2HX_13965 [Pyrinomonadaceae bacterium]
MTKVYRKTVAAFFLIAAVLIPVFSAAGQVTLPKSENLRVAPVEVIQVLEQPVNLAEAVLANTDNGYVLKCSISNNLGTPIIGLDYMLLVIDQNNSNQKLLSGSEEFKLKGHGTKSLISKTPLVLNVSQGYRLILIPNRVFDLDSIWEVHKAADALRAFASGDYSVIPKATRVTNLVDAPLGAEAKIIR